MATMTYMIILFVLYIDKTLENIILTRKEEQF